MSETILLLGAKAHPELQLIDKKLREAGMRVIIFDAARMPDEFQISWSATADDGILHCPDGCYKFTTINAAFWFRFALPFRCSESSTTQKEYQSLLNTLLHTQAISWCNNVEAIRYHQQKPQQLAHAKRMGLSIPSGYIGNCLTHAWKFVRQHQEVIIKPVHGGTFTEHLDTSTITKCVLAKHMKRSPLTLQAFIRGTNIRTYVINETVVSAEIISDSPDFRADEQASLKPHVLPDKPHNDALAVCQAFGMHWTAIDWRLTPDNEYVFLEANPAPCFLQFEQHSHHPVSDLLVNMLVEAAHENALKLTNQ